MQKKSEFLAWLERTNVQSVQAFMLKEQSVIDNDSEACRFEC
jgi:hypothetical protein